MTRTALPVGATRGIAFPGPDGPLLLPAHGRAAARAGVATYSACRPGVVALQHLAWALAATAGPRVLGRPHTQELPPQWQELAVAWEAALGPWDSHVLLGRRQPGRSGSAALLLREGTPLAFVRVRRRSNPLELHALERARSTALDVLHVPRLLASGSDGGWSWVATSTSPPRPHRRARPALGPVLLDVGRLLEGTARPAEVPVHWVPAHGDLTPWNLRRCGGGLWLYDWEDAGWAPPQADAVLHAATSAVLDRTDLPAWAWADDAAEARAHWARTAARRDPAAPDAASNLRLVEVLTRRPLTPHDRPRRSTP